MTTPSGNAAGTGFAALDVQMAVALGIGQEWANHRQAVDDGRLTFRPDKANDAKAALVEAIRCLDEGRTYLLDAPAIEGLGSYPSGIALARKFRNKLAEGYSVLSAHITVLQQMHDTIDAAARAYGQTEGDNRAGLTGTS